MRPPQLPLLALSLVLAACGGNTAESEPDPPPSSGCPAGSLEQGDACVEAGVPEDGCAEGFSWDPSRSCVAVLPAAACADGTMAVPGSESCRPVASCGSGPWGDIPIDGATQHVDAGFQGTSTGSATQPWTTIQQAVDAASSGGLVAVAAGSYQEAITIDKPVQLRGVCPEAVQVKTPLGEQAAILVLGSAPDTVLAGLNVSGTGLGIANVGAAGLQIESCYIHDNGSRGVELGGLQAPGSTTIRDTLIERATGLGIYVGGTTLVLERSVIRGTRSSSTVGQGFGLQSSWLEQTGAPSSTTITSSVLEGNTGAAIFALAGDTMVDASVLRDTLTYPIGASGVIALVEETSGLDTNVELSRSVVERNAEGGIAVVGATARIDRCTVRDTLGDDEQLRGHAVSIQGDAQLALPGNGTIVQSTIERNSGVGVLVSGGDAQLEGVRIRDGTRRGMSVQLSSLTGLPANATVAWSILENNGDFGVSVAGARAVIDASVLRGTTDALGLYGDGVAVVSLDEQGGHLEVKRSLIEQNARAGLAVFAAYSELGSTTLQCNPISLAAEQQQDARFALEDAGNNLCTCNSTSEECHAVSLGLAAPGPI